MEINKMISSVVAMYCLGSLMMTLEGTIGIKGNTFETMESRMFKKYVFTNTSKHWNHYMRKLLHNSLEVCYLKSNQCQLCNETVLNSINYLVQSSRKIVFHAKQVRRRFNYLVKSSGKIVFPEKQGKIAFPEKQVPSRLKNLLLQPLKTHIIKAANVHSSIHFHLHPTFHLNMTFHYIYFSSNTFLKCSFGKFIVWNGELNMGNISRFQYCGIVPSFTLYLSSNKVKLDIYVDYLITFSSTISHSVIDSYKIKSYPVKSNNSITITPISMIEILICESYLLKYEVQVQSFEILNVLCNVSQYELIEVYDGPGELYNKLEPFASKGNMALFTTTTFQTFIILCTKKKGYYHTLFITYNTEMSMSPQKYIYVEKNHIQLITSEMELNNSEIKIMKIKTEEHSFFNISVNHMEYKGKNHSLCGFAGVTACDITGNGSFSKILTICHNNNNQEYRYRNIYTQNSVILLIIYSYKKYSNFNVTLSVNTTQCKVTMMNICELPHDPLWLESTSYFSIRKHNCIVLQLGHGDTNISFFKMSKIFNTPSERYYTTTIATHLVRSK